MSEARPELMTELNPWLVAGRDGGGPTDLVLDALRDVAAATSDTEGEAWLFEALVSFFSRPEIAHRLLQLERRAWLTAVGESGRSMGEEHTICNRAVHCPPEVGATIGFCSVGELELGHSVRTMLAPMAASPSISLTGRLAGSLAGELAPPDGPRIGGSSIECRREKES